MKTDEDCNGLLTDSPVECKESSLSSQCHSRTKHCSSKTHLFLLYFLNVSLVAALVWSLNWHKDPSLTIFSPANEYIEYETKTFLDNVFELSEYQGEPTDEMDDLWDKLYGGTGFSLIDEKSQAKLPNKSVEVPGTGKYLVTLEMFHKLHCLNVLRMTNYPDRYPEYNLFNENGKRLMMRQGHVDHCIDRLRQGVMCSGDTGTLYWTWIEDLQQYRINMSSTHSCRNYDKIRDWAFSANYDYRKLPDSFFGVS